MLLESDLEKVFWAEALNAAIHIANRLPVADRVSPYEGVFGKPPRLSHLRVFGCKSFVQTPRATTKKLDPRAWIGGTGLRHSRRVVCANAAINLQLRLCAPRIQQRAQMPPDDARGL